MRLKPITVVRAAGARSVPVQTAEIGIRTRGISSMFSEYKRAIGPNAAAYFTAVDQGLAIKVVVPKGTKDQAALLKSLSTDFAQYRRWGEPIKTLKFDLALSAKDQASLQNSRSSFHASTGGVELKVENGRATVSFPIDQILERTDEINPGTQRGSGYRL